jgi:hypothetical protein
MDVAAAEAAAITVTVSRVGDDLAWQVQNSGQGDVWAFLLVPTIADGRQTFAVDSAWLASEGETLLVRKVDTPLAGRRAVASDDDVRTGAVLLKPGEVRRGLVRLGNEVTLRHPYEGEGPRVPVTRVVMEVGWVPWREAAQPQRLEWKGQPFAYLYAEDEPGGQRFARSVPLDWARPS